MPRTKSTRHTYRCTLGHSWSTAETLANSTLSLSFGIHGNIENICPVCLKAWWEKQLRDRVGIVTEVTDGTQEKAAARNGGNEL